jgi:hypothetical protein
MNQQVEIMNFENHEKEEFVFVSFLSVDFNDHSQNNFFSQHFVFTYPSHCFHMKHEVQRKQIYLDLTKQT